MPILCTRNQTRNGAMPFCGLGGFEIAVLVLCGPALVWVYGLPAKSGMNGFTDFLDARSAFRYVRYYFGSA